MGLQQMDRHKIKYPILALIGGCTYYVIELLYRGYSHWTMFLLASFAFIFMGYLNEFLSWDTPLYIQCVISAIFITGFELVFGLIFNSNYQIWDYRDMAFNYKGHISLLFSLVWMGLSAIGIVVDDYLRYWLWDEEKPRYKLF